MLCLLLRVKIYVSLFTCTPYGVNSHRLIVRGHRVEYNGEEDVKSICWR